MAQRSMPESKYYPNNSERARARIEPPEASSPETTKVTKVTKGKTVQRKKSFGRRFAEAFGAREGQGVIDYILYDIIIPATKNMIVDSIINGAEMAILGETRGRRRGYSQGTGVSRYRYDRVSYRDDYDRRDRDRYEDSRRLPRGMSDYEDILYDTKEDAEEVLSSMLDMIDAYGQATVQDLYGFAGITPEYTCGNFGWRNLSRAYARRDRDGWVLDLPKAIVL